MRLLVSVCGMRKNGRWPTLPVVGLSARSSLVTVLDRDFTCAVTCCMCSSVMSPVVAYTIKRAIRKELLVLYLTNIALYLPHMSLVTRASTSNLLGISFRSPSVW